jgi:hypothetical protein
MRGGGERGKSSGCVPAIAIFSNVRQSGDALCGEECTRELAVMWGEGGRERVVGRWE